MKYINEFVGKMMDSEGRTSRNDFWMTMLWIILFNVAFNFVVYFIGLFAKMPNLLWTVSLVPNIVLFLASISMQIRRLHDTNRPSLLIFVHFIPVVGQIYMLVMYMLPGDAEANKYGEPTSI